MSSELENKNEFSLNEKSEDRNGLRPNRGRKRHLRVLLISAVAVCIVAAMFLLIKRAHGNATAAAEENSQPVVSVRVTVTKRKTFSETVSAVGTVYPRAQAAVSANISAQILRMPAVVNRRFHAGDIVAVLDTRDIRAQRDEAAAQLDEARMQLRSLVTGDIPEKSAQNQKELDDASANLDAARSVYEQRKALFDKGGISRRDLESSQLALTTAENQYNLAKKSMRLADTVINANDRSLYETRIRQAQGRLEQLNAQMNYAEVRAPISGVVTEQNLFQGERADVGSKMFTIADVSEMIVKAPFGDTVASQLRVGDTVTVFPQEYPGVKLTGSISLIGIATDPLNRTVEVWISLKNPDGLRPNSAATVMVSTNVIPRAIVLPASAVTLDATTSDKGAVMVVDKHGTVHERKVIVGIHSGDAIQVKSGLDAGETVVVEGNYALPDGTKVRIAAAHKNRGKQRS